MNLSENAEKNRKEAEILGKRNYQSRAFWFFQTEQLDFRNKVWGQFLNVRSNSCFIMQSVMMKVETKVRHYRICQCICRWKYILNILRSKGDIERVILTLLSNKLTWFLYMESNKITCLFSSKLKKQ